MRTLARAFVFVLALASAQPLLAQTVPIKIFGLVELSGTGATSGTNFDNGVKLAVKEINASGGILGRQVEYSSADTQSSPQVTETNKALADPAIAKKLSELGVVVTPSTPEQFGAFINKQTELWSGVVKSAGIQPD